MRKARELTGLGQTEFAAEIGVSRGTVSTYESATTGDSLKRPYLMAWSMRTEVPLDWLQNGDSNRPEGPGGGEVVMDELAKLTHRKHGRGATTDDGVSTHRYVAAA